MAQLNYRAHTGMMIGPEMGLAQGKLQYIPRYSSITCLLESSEPSGATETSSPWEELSSGQSVYTDHPKLCILMADVNDDGCLGGGPVVPQDEKCGGMIMTSRL